MAQTYLVPAIREVLAAGDINAADWRLQQGAALVRESFPGCKPDFGRSSSYSWQLDEFARGAYGLVAPGQYYSWYPGAGSVEGRIHCAGEHLSATPGFMQGAITSGHGAAVAVNDGSRVRRS